MHKLHMEITEQKYLELAEDCQDRIAQKNKKINYLKKNIARKNRIIHDLNDRVSLYTAYIAKLLKITYSYDKDVVNYYKRFEDYIKGEIKIIEDYTSYESTSEEDSSSEATETSS